MRKMTAKQVEAAARADPDAQPLTDSDLKRMKRSPRVKIIRQALGLTQEEFASRFEIPIGTLRDWEQQRKEPDQTAKTYLKVIARAPDVIYRALHEKPASA
jgi:putative transcriptional regulator